MSESVHYRGVRSGTPVPITERERMVTKPILSIEQWGTERVSQYLAEKYPVKQPKRKVEIEVATVIEMTREEYLAERAAGKNRAQIANELGLKHQAYLYPQLEKWGVKDRDAETDAIRLLSKPFTLDKPSQESLEEVQRAIKEVASTKVNSVAELIREPEPEIVSKPSEAIIERAKELIKGVGPDAPTVVTDKGGKHSGSPYRMDLVDPLAMFEMAKVLAEGSQKYGEDNWRLISVRDHLNHLLVHSYAYLAGDTSDDHLTHMFCRAMFAVACELEANRKAAVN